MNVNHALFSFTFAGVAFGVGLARQAHAAARANGHDVLVLDTDGTVLHSELVPEIAQEPDYDAAIASLG